MLALYIYDFPMCTAESCLKRGSHDGFFIRTARLPDVPRLSEVACIQVDLPHDEASEIEQDLVQAIQQYGHILERAPLQISEIEERPGGVLLRWAEVSLQIYSMSREIMIYSGPCDLRPPIQPAKHGLKLKVVLN